MMPPMGSTSAVWGIAGQRSSTRRRRNTGAGPTRGTTWPTCTWVPMGRSTFDCRSGLCYCFRGPDSRRFCCTEAGAEIPAVARIVHSRSVSRNGSCRQGENMNVQDILAQARDTITVKRVFGDPYEKDGMTIIPAAAVAGGAGGGSGPDAQANAGGGFGVAARPAGVYVIKEGQV